MSLDSDRPYLEQRVFVDQVPEVIPVQPVVQVQLDVMGATSEEEQLRLARFKKYHPPDCSGLSSKDAHGFLEEFHRILRTIGIKEMSGVAFTTFKLSGAAYQWWRVYEEGSLTDATSLTWTRFLEMLLRDFVHQTLQDAGCMEFEQLRQGTITVLEYAVRFSDLSRHATSLVSTIGERNLSRGSTMVLGSTWLESWR
ncbi:uncharacterized protein [Nicotiana sylvestris]|uniref:uncharacterized protein n=1 Tax=Nicotiana sylvestris TaxID=4096 RepID=UPI00388CAF2B